MINIISLAKKVVPAIATGISILYSKPAPGYGNVYDAIQEKNYKVAGQAFIAGMTGIKIGGIGGQTETDFRVFEALNPIELEHAPFPKIALWSSLAMEGITRVGSFIRSLFTEMTKTGD